MRKRFLLILSLFIIISLIVAGGTCFFFWQKEKAKQEAFATPTLSKDINWIVNENVIEKEALYIEDNQNGSHSKPVALKGTEYSFTEIVANEEQAYSRIVEEAFLANYNTSLLEKNGWRGVSGVLLNNKYTLYPSNGMGVLGYVIGYMKVWGGNVRVILWRENTEDTTLLEPNLPYTEQKMTYPFHREYKIFVSEIVPIKSIIPEL